MNESNEIRAKEIFDTLYLNEKQLTSGQVAFINSCKKQLKKNRTLSMKQIEILQQMKRYLPEQTRYSNHIEHEKKY